METLPEPMMTQFCDLPVSLGHSDLKHLTCRGQPKYSPGNWMQQDITFVKALKKKAF